MNKDVYEVGPLALRDEGEGPLRERLEVVDEVSAEAEPLEVRVVGECPHVI